MNRTKIEWADYTANPIKGKCRTGCSYCYARKMYDRFKWDPTVRLDRGEFGKIATIKLAPSKIFLCSMHELFGEWIPTSWIKYVLENCRGYPYHIFQILTKCPVRAKEFDFPDIVWLGVTVTSFLDWLRVCLLQSCQAKVKFISFEPLLDDALDTTNISLSGIDWVIIGAQTKPTVLPHPSWVYRIIDKARHEGIPLFLKANLHWPERIQEFPKEV